MNKNRVYVHEVFDEASLIEEGAREKEKSDPLQTRANTQDVSQPPGGIALYKKILNPLFAVKPEDVKVALDENMEPLADEVRRIEAELGKPGNTALSAAMRATRSIDGRFADGAAVFRTLDAIERTAVPTVLPEPVRKALADWTRERSGATRKRLVAAVLGAIPERERFYMDTENGRRLPLSNNAVDSALFGHASSDGAVAGKAAFLLAIPTFSKRAVQVYSEGYGNGRHTTYVAPASYGKRQAYGTATVSGAGNDLSLHEINYFDPREKLGPARTTTLQQNTVDRRSYSDGPNTKRILQLIHDNQALPRDELNERIHELGANTAFSVGERPGRAPEVRPGGDIWEAGEGTLAWLRRKFVHSQSPVFETVRRVMGRGVTPPDWLNVEAAAKNVHGKIRARQEMLQRAYLEPLKAILAQPGMDRKRFDDYALALHALERNRMIQARSVVVDPETGEVVDLGVEAGSGVSQTSKFPTLQASKLPNFQVAKFP